jgi:proline racemase
MPRRLEVETVDYHTAGEPFRIVTAGVPALEGRTILEKRRFAADNLDHVRGLLVNEPRGHADMYGCFVTEPEDDGADIGVVFFHNAGYSTACGHGTIALVTWALESGRIPATEPRTRVVVDVPSGRLVTLAALEEGDVTSVRFENVPSFVLARDLAIVTSVGDVAVDIAFGGAFYASVDAAALDLEVRPENLALFIDLGREIKASIEKEHDIVHPDEPELRDVYGVIFFEELGSEGPELRQRNVTIFADGEVDRSPCGSGTSARLALLDADGDLSRDRELVHLSIIDTEFRARVTGDARVAEHPAVITEVEGSAHVTGHHSFVLEPRDELGTGFLLR